LGFVRSGEEQTSFVDAEFLDFVKFLRRGGLPLDVPPDVQVLAFEEHYHVFPLIRHGTRSAADETLGALRSFVPLLKNPERVLSVSVSAVTENVETRLSLLGGSRALVDWLQRFTFPPQAAEAGTDWVTSVSDYLNRLPPVQDEPALGKVIKADGIFFLPRVKIPREWITSEPDGSWFFRLDVKNLPMGIDALEARLYFKGFYGDENLTLKAQLDVTQFDRIYLPVQERRLLHPYSDSESCAGMVRCQKIEEILASKLTTLLHRRKAIDLFDLLYTILFTKEFPVERLQVISTFLKKSIFEPQPSVAKEQLLAVPLDDFRPLWTTLVAPVQSLFGFDYVVSNFRTLIESLFEGVLRPLAVAPFPSRGFGRGGIAPGNVRQGAAHADPAYFQWDVRSVIVSAGRSNHLVELVYDGWRRLVEPYSFEYYVRKSDGRGVEYFWGYDTTGGKSGPGIKRFICDKIESVSMSNILFTPQQSVEF
jgi:hypothetical protein